jgi:hypothetical protein
MQFGRPTNFAGRRRLYKLGEPEAPVAGHRAGNRAGIGKFRRRRAADADRRQILRGARAVHPQDRERPFPALALRRLRRDLRAILPGHLPRRIRDRPLRPHADDRRGVDHRGGLGGAVEALPLIPGASRKLVRWRRGQSFSTSRSPRRSIRTLSPRRMRRATKISTRRSAASSSRSARFWATSKAPRIRCSPSRRRCGPARKRRRAAPRSLRRPRPRRHAVSP